MGYHARHMRVDQRRGERPRLVLVEDHALIISRVSALLLPACEIVATAADGRTALEAIRTFKPDVVVLDVSLPDMSGLDVARQLSRDHPSVAIIFMSAYDDEEIKRAAAGAGGNGYIVKSHISDLVDAVLRAADARQLPGPPRPEPQIQT
jgi:DNA-binding NarL/FixJ family response regulator